MCGGGDDGCGFCVGNLFYVFERLDFKELNITLKLEVGTGPKTNDCGGVVGMFNSVSEFPLKTRYNHQHRKYHQHH